MVIKNLIATLAILALISPVTFAEEVISDPPIEEVVEIIEATTSIEEIVEESAEKEPVEEEVINSDEELVKEETAEGAVEEIVEEVLSEEVTEEEGEVNDEETTEEEIIENEETSEEQAEEVSEEELTEEELIEEENVEEIVEEEIEEKASTETTVEQKEDWTELFEGTFPAPGEPITSEIVMTTGISQEISINLTSFSSELVYDISGPGLSVIDAPLAGTALTPQGQAHLLYRLDTVHLIPGRHEISVTLRGDMSKYDYIIPIYVFPQW